MRMHLTLHVLTDAEIAFSQQKVRNLKIRSQPPPPSSSSQFSLLVVHGLTLAALHTQLAAITARRKMFVHNPSTVNIHLCSLFSSFDFDTCRHSTPTSRNGKNHSLETHSNRKRNAHNRRQKKKRKNQCRQTEEKNIENCVCIIACCAERDVLLGWWFTNESK